MSVKQLLFVFCLIKCCASTEDETNQPWKLPTSYADDADLSECLLRSTKIVSPLLEKSVLELGSPTFSPYFIPLIKYEQSNSKANYIYLMKNVTLTGLNTSNFTKFKFDADKLKLSASFNLPHLMFEGNFSVNGKLLGVVINRDGHFTLNITNSEGTIKQFLRLSTRNGLTYLEPVLDLTRIYTGTFSYIQEDLHDNDSLNDDEGSKAVQEYESYWIEYYRTVIEKELVNIVTDVLLPKVYQVPYDKLFD